MNRAAVRHGLTMLEPDSAVMETSYMNPLFSPFSRSLCIFYSSGGGLRGTAKSGPLKTAVGPR